MLLEKETHLYIIHHWDSTAELFSWKRKNKNHPPSASPIYIWHSREMCRPLFFFYPQRESSSFFCFCARWRRYISRPAQDHPISSGIDTHK